METFEHPEIGRVLADNSGAAGDPGDNAYSRSQGPATPEIERLVEQGRIDAVLASDGWWWRIRDGALA